MKTITIETSTGKEYFEIEEYSKIFSIYKIDYRGFLGSKRKTNIGQAKNLDDAITIAKSSVSGSINKIDIK